MGYFQLGDDNDNDAIDRHYGWGKYEKQEADDRQCFYCGKGSEDADLVERKYKIFGITRKETVCIKCLKELQAEDALEERERNAPPAKRCANAPSTPTYTRTGE